MAVQSVAPVLFESVSAVTATPSIEVGSERVEGDEHYVYVYNAGNSQISVGRVAIASAVSGYSVTVSSISGDFAVGLVKHATMTTGTYGWLCTRGFVDSVTNGMASTALAAGNPIQVAADGSVCKGETGPYIGKMMTATGSAGVAHAFISIF
jgi:hypothetical protein